MDPLRWVPDMSPSLGASPNGEDPARRGHHPVAAPVGGVEDGGGRVQPAGAPRRRAADEAGIAKGEDAAGRVEDPVAIDRSGWPRRR